MVLSENMRNMQKRDSKHEPKTKGSYKIRQVMKIMEYTHIHIHPKQSERSQAKIKYSRSSQRMKEIKNYIYLLRTKL